MEATSSIRERLRHRVDKAHRYVRRLSIIICVVVVALVAVWFFVKNRANEMIRSHIEDKFNEHYAKSGIHVSIESARLIEGEAIVLYGLSFRSQTKNSLDDEIVQIGEVVLTCDVQLHELLIDTPRISRVSVRRLKVLAARDDSGKWSVERLLPLPSAEHNAPLIPVSIWDSSLEIRDEENDHSDGFRLTEINLSIEPTSAPSNDIQTVANTARMLEVEGSMAGNYVRRIQFGGMVDLDRSDWFLKGKAEDLAVSHQLAKSLPRELSEALEPLSTLRAKLTVDFKVRSAPERDIPIAFSVTGQLAEGQIDDPRLPYPLTDIQADVACDNRGFRVDKMTARSGLGTIHFDCAWEGFSSSSPMRLRAKVDRLLLNEDLKAALPEPVQALWERYSPSGTVDAEFNLTFDGDGWSPDLAVNCKDVSFAFDKFPYRFEDCEGDIHWNDRVCTMDLHARASGRPVHFDGKFVNPGKDYTGRLIVSVDGPVPLDQHLLDALDPRVRGAVLAFRPRGQITFAGSFTRKQPRERLIPDIQIGLHNCSMKFDSFPYPIDRIDGTLQLVDRQWEFRNLTGHNDSGYFTCDGAFAPNGSGSNVLQLTIIGTDIPLEEELRQALAQKNRQAAKLWSDLRPQGTLNHVRVNLRYQTDTRQLAMDVQAQKWRRPGELQGRSITIEPVWFPYRLDDVEGLIQLRDGQVTLHNISGVHGKNTRWFFSGGCSFTANDWTLKFDQVQVRRLRVDDEFTSALPTKLGNALSQLRLGGLVSINGALSLSGHHLLRNPARAAWDLSIDVDNGSLNCGVQLDHIYGGIEHLKGQFDGKQFQSRGNLSIDSVIYKGMQLTKVSGPLWIDESRVAFGAWAQPSGNRGPQKHIAARAFGGLLEGDAAMTLTGDWPFHLQVQLQDADLAAFARDAAPDMRDLAGNADAGIRLKGDSKGVHTFQGDGYVRVRDAQIAEIPVLLSMLKLLSIRELNRTAFNSGEMDFRIHGDHLYFDRVNLSGDAISLRGMGSVNLDRDVDLTFYTMIGRNEINIPLVTPILGLASQQFLRIHIDGKLDNPNRPTREVLPALNDTLRAVLYPELAQRQRSGQVMRAEKLPSGRDQR